MNLGARLFDRTPDGTLASAAAEHLIPFAEDMERAASGFAHGLEDFEVDADGLVHLTAPPGVITHFLAAGLPRLLKRHPRLRLEITASADYLDLARREADLALRTQRPTTGDVVSRRLVTSHWIVAGSPELVAEVEHLRHTNDARWVTWSAGFGHLPDSRWVNEHVPENRIVLRSNGMTGLIEAVRASLGLVLLPAPYALLAGLEVVYCSAPLRQTLAELPATELWIATHRAYREIPRIAAVWNWLSEVLSGADQTTQ